ncbi:HNH endonuclease [Streptomyces sp. NBC_00986]|uniref:HNH endonuclease n=1 Tax=Streptomyces sp. NBC_00986 TaxID=2903702 RepID=UPI003869F8FA|nr:HNH endonuclease [Streptomyces sp. NBC_00986]
MTRGINAKSPEARQRLMERIASRKRQGWQCLYCRRPFTDELRPTLDHFIPYSLWRTGWQQNLVLACDPCNNAKADALPWTVAYLLLDRVARSEAWRRVCLDFPADPNLYERAA